MQAVLIRSNPCLLPYIMKTKALKIFVVDDDIFCQQLYVQYLSHLGYTDIEAFSSGIECIENLHKDPQLVFLDYSMDDMNGIEVLKTIRAYDPEIQVIFISGQEDVEVAVDTLHYGAFDYIVKSRVSPKLLEAIITGIEEEKKMFGKYVNQGFFKKIMKDLGLITSQS